MWGKTYLKQFVIATSMTVALGGCAELHNRGGLADHTADRLFLADTKEMRVLRGYVILAGLSGLATEADLDENQRKLTASQIRDSLEKLHEAAHCAHQKNSSKNPCFYLDNRMLDFSKTAFKLAIAVLPVDEAKSLINRAQGGNPLAIADLIAIARDSFRLGLRFGAIYRDGWDMYMSVAIHGMSNESAATFKHINSEHQIADGLHSDEEARRKKYLVDLMAAYGNGNGDRSCLGVGGNWRAA